MKYYSEWKKVLRTARFKGYELMGTDDFDIFQELCKVVEERFVNDPITAILLRAVETYGQQKGFYINHSVVDYNEIEEGLKYNNYAGEVYRQKAYPIIAKVLNDNYDYILAELGKEIPMVNKRSRNANNVIAEYEKLHGGKPITVNTFGKKKSDKVDISDDKKLDQLSFELDDSLFNDDDDLLNIVEFDEDLIVKSNDFNNYNDDN